MEPLDADVVTTELDRVAQRILPRIYATVDKNGPLSIPQLETIAARGFPDQWQRDRISALRATLLAAIAQLTGSFRKISQQYAAVILFNLDGSPAFSDIHPLDLDHIDGQRYPLVLRRLAEVSGLLVVSSTLRSDVNRLRRDLAAILVNPAFPVIEMPPPTRPDSGLVVRSVVADEYVARPAYEQAIRQLREADAPHVWLWGEAGTGKSRLARAANRDRIVESAVPVLVWGDEAKLDTRFGDLAVKAGVSVAAVNAGNRQLHFFEQLTKGKLPKVLVFDNTPVEPITDDSLVGKLVATRGSFLIFTSIGAPPASYHGPKIEIQGMTQAESDQMIHSRLPEISDRDFAQLHAVLGARPLAIEHSCAFLRETDMSVREYCQAFVKDPATVLDTPGEQHTLTKVYMLVLEQLASSRDLIRLLDLLVFSTDLMTTQLLAEVWADGLELPAAMPDSASEIDNDYLRSASLWCSLWKGVRFIDPTRLPKIDPLASVTLRQALRRLEGFGLVRSDAGRLVMHQLTRAILRALRDEQADNIYQRIRQTVYDTVHAENWKGGDALSATRLWWAPQLREALARALRTVPGPTDISTAEAIGLATLAAVMLRAHRQLGLDPTVVLNDAARAAVVASFRHQVTADADPNKDALWTAYRTIHTELLEFLILARGFDRTVDSFPYTDRQSTPEERWRGNTLRLTHSTEWDLVGHYLTGGEQRAREHNTIGWRLGATGERATLQGVRRSAEDAITMATLYYDQARWDAASEALEHAYGCYLQIGASVEAIRGAMDAGRRLARVHLRAGSLDEAGAWLDRVIGEVYLLRSECLFDGKPSPFKLVDQLLRVQLEQARVELELTKTVLEWDQSDAELLPEMVASVVAPWHEHAKRAVDQVRALRAIRLIPEFSMHAFRLQALTGSAEGIEELSHWFDPEKEPYRAALLRLQIATFLAPFMVPILAVTDEEFHFYRREMPAAQVEHAEQIRSARDQMGVELVELAQEVGVTHGNPYWHVRGICAAAMMATAADADPAWAASLRDTAKQGAQNIGRPDWAEKIDGFGDTNTGLWLIGY